MQAIIISIFILKFMIICLLVFLIASFPTKIQSCGSNCLVCRTVNVGGGGNGGSGNTIDICQACEPTFGLSSGSNNCVACSVENCISCDNNQALCSECASGLGTRGNDKCQPCNTPQCKVTNKIAHC